LSYPRNRGFTLRIPPWQGNC